MLEKHNYSAKICDVSQEESYEMFTRKKVSAFCPLLFKINCENLIKKVGLNLYSPNQRFQLNRPFFSLNYELRFRRYGQHAGKKTASGK